MWVLRRVQVCHHAIISQKFLHIQSRVVRSTLMAMRPVSTGSPLMLFSPHIFPSAVIECLPRNVSPQFAVCVMNLWCTFWCLAKEKNDSRHFTLEWTPMAPFGHRARPFTKNMVCGFFNISKVSIAVLTDLKQNLMHICCLIRSVIFWRTGYCRVHNVQSCFTGHYFIMTKS